ncbi:MAG: adenylate/guanylate cyclase domain-containing protein [Betaproteobacteria bacterium]|jgi:predicted ATPase/class 3 adenylate cyclase|nr:adenylate/guanylate cyclase domain-containing protein [Betaproteobacteria bacterium]MBK7590685.1 adenylate/guanylate cyclase domain-containing protein [Betaproteobacteria bacterium]MBK7743757.1 adenylate/guanylate cyclase domain-containing protein [Betaproteobacteria bacterium]MBK8687535.1 adenylate/guanylate cyclase domain-containing protein [Betaproteobacteria bacterium]MBK9674142.1 adenylate/guanylate cyclase domain-containing protein [Betaproteobacteria bacterium]
MEASPDVNVFLFTDIEGSTSAWEKEHDRMAQAVALHDAILRSEIESRGGRVIKTTGDGVYAMFADPLEAVQAVLAFQLALADPVNTGGMPIRVRCGLHAGVAVERDGDYFGTTINRTARIMGVGHGGQVLLSASVVDLVRDSLPPELSLRELGAVRLKDLAAPEQVSQLVHPGLAHEFPPLRSLEALPNNLPQQLTSFVGRERELAEAKALLGKTRLLTLLGMGGLGKTRLSLQIGADLLDEFPDGVWFVDLAPITDASLVPNEAAQVLGVREEPGKPILQTLTAHLKSRKLLVIVDNCEHLMDACANFANTVLRAVREVRIIATSREALRVPGEQTYPVFPLPVPERDASVESLSRSDAVQLFVERAQAQKPSFALTEKDAPAIAELVARLEGIPLALELAAARIRALSLQDINKRLQNRFALLTGGGRVLMERQQTLRALVAWSYDLLTDHEQLLFDRLSVFAGGFDLAAAEAVSGVEPLMPEDVLDLVASLVDKSLVMVQEADDEMRYRMLETIREYAGEGLVKRDEQAAAVVRHCEHYLGVAKAARDQLKGPEQAQGMRRLERDLDNLRAAIARSAGGGADPVIAVKIEVALMRFWILRGYATEGRNNVRSALELPEVQAVPVANAHALYVGGTLAASQSDYAEARRMLAACLELRRGLGNPREIAATLSTLAVIRLNEGDAAGARQSEEEALAIFRELKDRIGEGIGLLHLAEICFDLGDADACRSQLEQGLALARSIKHPEIEGECERALGELAFEAADLPSAKKRLTRALDVARGAEDRRGEATALWWLARADLAAGDVAVAAKRVAEALRAFRKFEMNAELLGCLDDHARILHLRGHSAEAARLYAAVEAARERLVLRRRGRHEQRWRSDVAAVRAALGDPAFEAAWAEGEGWSLEQALQHEVALAPAGAVAA